MTISRFLIYRKTKDGTDNDLSAIEFFGVRVRGKKTVVIHGVNQIFGVFFENLENMSTIEAPDPFIVRAEHSKSEPNVFTITTTQDNVKLMKEFVNFRVIVLCKVENRDKVDLKEYKKDEPELDPLNFLDGLSKKEGFGF